jgi:hypothetical protein
MSVPFDRWSASIHNAADEVARRTLLGEILQWRKTQLFDVRAQRDAAWAISNLLVALGEKELAIREAQGLLSLTQSPPEATRDEATAARRWLDQLRGTVTPERAPRQERAPRPERGERQPRQDRPERPARAERPERPERRDSPREADPYELARSAAQGGRWDAALSALTDRRGARFELLKTWIVLARALQNPDLDRRGRDLFALEEELRASLLSERGERTPNREPARGVDAAHPAIVALAKRLGDLPADRDALVALAEAAATSPKSADDIAAAALRHHVAVHGEREPAPWWFTLVTRAMSQGDGRQVKQAIADLGDAWAVSAYAEPAFESVLSVARNAATAGLTLGQVRRGIASRGEPKDRRIWTVRLNGPHELGVAVAGAQVEPYRPETAERLGARLAELGIAAIYAPGSGNEGLLATARAHGVATPDRIEAIAWSAAPAGDRPAPRAPRAPRADAFEGVRAALSTDPLTVEALVGPIAALPRAHRVFPIAREVFADRDDLDARMAIVLQAAHLAAPPGVRLAEGTSIALEAAAMHGLDSPLGRLLVDADTAARYGGAGVTELLGVAAATRNVGLRIGRVLRGATLREKKASPVVDALGDSLDALWRLLVQRDGANGPFRAEIWFVSELTPEVKTAAPILLAEAHPRAVVLATPALAEGWASLGLAPAISWGEGAEAALASATDGWR